MPLLVIPDRVKNLIGRLGEGERSELSWEGVVGRAVEGVELGGEEPGEGGEHKVEHVLPNVHHDVVVQPKPIGNGFPVLKTIVIIDTKAIIPPIYKREAYPFPPVDPVEGLVLFGSGCASSGGGSREKKNPKDHSDSLSTSCKRSSRARVQQGLGHKSKFRLLYRRWWPRIGRAFFAGNRNIQGNGLGCDRTWA